MRNKSVINIKKSLADDINAGRFKYGAIIAESYWKQTPEGFIIESQPVTSDIIDFLFYPFYARLKDDKIYINDWFTDLRIEHLNDAGGVHIERIVLKPDLNAPPTPPDFINRQCWENYRQHWSIND